MFIFLKFYINIEDYNGDNSWGDSWYYFYTFTFMVTINRNACIRNGLPKLNMVTDENKLEHLEIRDPIFEYYSIKSANIRKG